MPEAPAGEVKVIVRLCHRLGGLPKRDTQGCQPTKPDASLPGDPDTETVEIVKAVNGYASADPAPVHSMVLV